MSGSFVYSLSRIIYFRYPLLWLDNILCFCTKCVFLLYFLFPFSSSRVDNESEYADSKDRGFDNGNELCNYVTNLSCFYIFVLFRCLDVWS